MAPPKPNGIGLIDIYELQVKTAATVGDIQGRLHYVEADVSGIRASVIDHGRQIALLQQTCAGRMERCREARDGIRDRVKKISHEVGMVKEDTGVIHLERAQDNAAQDATWKLLAKIGAAIVAVGGLFAAVWSAIWR